MAEAASRRPKVCTFLMFKRGGAEAIRTYASLFRGARILSMNVAGEGAPVPAGALLNATFEIGGQRYMAMDGGDYFSFAQGFSLFVDCETQEEIDLLWDKLSEGGEKLQCGWVTDRWGVSWQIVPSVLGELMSSKDAARVARVTQAMLKMKKLEIEGLERAAEG